MEAHEYRKAVALLDPAIAESKNATERTDAKFLKLEAQYKGLVYESGSPEVEALYAETDDVIKEADKHPRIPEALRWKAQLYEQDHLPYAAQDLYKKIIEQYPGTPDFDQTLLDASRLAMVLKYPREAADYAQRLLNEFPGSPCAPKAHLLLGDAYAMAGMEDDARTLYVRLADNEPGSSRSSEAYLRLGRLAMDQKNYDAAIQHLETCLKTSSSQEGNDAIYLMLGQAYRQKGRLDDAQKMFNDLIHFFPDSKRIPDGMVELSQVTEAKGNRKEAVEIAQQAARRFPDNPLALRNNGEFQGLEGNAFSAANALVAADEAGANDPAALLTAARHYRTLAMDDQAQQTYRRLREEYAKSPESITAGVEEADVLYREGKVSQAVQQLDDLARATSPGPQRVNILSTTARIYRDLGLTEAAKEVSQQIASTSSDPQLLAETAIDLIDSSDLEAAQKIVEKISLSQVNTPTAYALLMKFGQALLKVNPQRGLAKMEEAYLNYPEARVPEDDQRLLQAYLAANLPAAARRLVMEKSAEARNTPSRAPELILAANGWGDYLYNKGDYRAAADAYALSVDAVGKSKAINETTKAGVDWAKYQRANALLELADFQASLMLYNEVASSASPWAKEAGVKAGYAKLEQQLRGGINPADVKKEG
jgi:TolA-binding protein